MNILFITRLYPSDCYDNGQTGMGHYLCREFVKAGHDVRVIHEDMRYCKRWSAFERTLPDIRRFKLDAVPVSFIKLNRPLPKYRWLPGGEAKKAAEFILEETKGFAPDVVFAFFCYDQWKVIERLRPRFACPIVPIFHNCDVKFSDKQVGKILDASPVAGGVSRRILDKLRRIRPDARTFMCYGGAPNDVSGSYAGEKHNDVFSVVYAGMLIPLKNVDITLQSLAALKDTCEFRFDIYGEGEEEQNLKHLARILGIVERVVFHGKVPRDEVLAAMGKADCFAMVSSPETFGLTGGAPRPGVARRRAGGRRERQAGHAGQRGRVGGGAGTVFQSTGQGAGHAETRRGDCWLFDGGKSGGYDVKRRFAVR